MSRPLEVRRPLPVSALDSLGEERSHFGPMGGMLDVWVLAVNC